MKQIIAVVKPFLAEKIILAVSQLEIEEISIREVKGFGRQKNYIDRYGENEFSLVFVPKVEISVWIRSENVESVVDRISKIARTGRLGDGKIFIVPVADEHALSPMDH
ncbi:MAG: P-II family nitrogen regulator [Planctomycetota bacterium]